MRYYFRCNSGALSEQCYVIDLDYTGHDPGEVLAHMKRGNKIDMYKYLGLDFDEDYLHIAKEGNIVLADRYLVIGG